MKRLRYFLLTTLGIVLPLSAGTSGIGFAVSNGAFKVGSAQVNGSATVFDGSVIETGASVSRIQLENGANVLLGPQSRGEVHQSRFVLNKGTGQVRMNSSYSAEAQNLQIVGDGGATARIGVGAGTSVQVGSLSGTVQVKNMSGLLLAKVSVGTSFDFTPNAGEPSAVELTGRLIKVGNHYYLDDETAHIRAELRGSDLKKYEGKRVQVEGKVDSTPGEGANEAVDVSSITPIASSSRAATAAGTAPAATGGTHTALIAGIAVAGAGAAAGIGYVVSGAGDTTSPSSR